MNIIIHRFLSMPGVMKLVFISFFLLPFISSYSVISSGLNSYGAGGGYRFGHAQNLTELMILVAATLPAPCVAVLLFKKNRISIALVPFASLAAFMSPFALQSVREGSFQGCLPFFMALAMSALIVAYMLLSRDVNDYFSEK